MRILYAAVIAFLVLSTLALIGTFILLDQNKRSTYYYNLTFEGRQTGQARIDRIKTEDKVIYRSQALTPFYPLFTEHKAKLTLERDYTLDSYSRERSAKAAVETRNLYRKDVVASFVSRFEAAFAFMRGMQIKKDSFVFEEDSPVTYMPILECYDFTKGGSQGFNALTFPKEQSLPPVKRYVTLTSIRDEYVKVGNRKIKTENLVLKIRNYPAGNVWVAKSDKSLVKVEIQGIGLSITRDTQLRKTEAKEYLPVSAAYTAREAIFSNKKITLAGTITVPGGAGPFPAVLLVWGQGPQDRNYQGLFSSMADILSTGGFAVLRFDKRGTGSSQGDSGTLTEKDESGDIAAALDYLAAQKEVDPGRITVISHSKGARIAIMAVAEKQLAGGMVFMAPAAGLPSQEACDLAGIKESARIRKWTDEYVSLAEQSVRETYKRALSSKHDWGYVLGKLCFMRRVKESMEDLLPYIVKLKIPALILYGQKDSVVDPSAVSELDKALRDAGPERCTLTYFSYLGHFFGKQINDGIYRARYEIDKDVMENIKSWIGGNLPAIEVEKI